MALLCCIALDARAETFTARVIAVLDGDTVLILQDGSGTARHSLAPPLRGARKSRPEKLRLANIDAPEKAQAFGVQSRASLSEMVGKKRVQIDTHAVDQYGRVVGLVSVEGRSVNQEQVRRGMAWEYSHHHSDKTYVALQNEAQQAKRGLWTQTAPQPPWQWRKRHPSAKPPAANPNGIRAPGTDNSQSARPAE